MPSLFGVDYTPDRLRQLGPAMAQFAGIRLVELADGKARGLRVAEVYTGSGFRFDVLLDRAMDLGAAEYAGRPLAWVHGALGTPGQYEPEGAGWQRTWGGGLLTTCGLSHIGPPDTDGGERFGLHGRIAHIPAADVRVTQAWSGERYLLMLEGEMRETVVGGAHLLLSRRITAALGSRSVLIEDTVRNEGFRPAPHVLLYHCNFGFPLVAPGAALLIRDEALAPRDAAAAAGLATHAEFGPPQVEYPEQVFFHKLRADGAGFACTAIVNRALGLGLSVRQRVAELPYLAHWKLLAAGDYVTALEPTTQWDRAPRAEQRAAGRLRTLAPGAEVRYQVELSVLVGADELAACAEQLNEAP